MKRSGTFIKIVAAALVFCMLFAFTSCLNSLNGLKVKSFTVDRNSVVTEYFIGEEIDFSGIKIAVTYSDETLNTVYTHENADISITYDDNITATEGTKSVTVSMTDPHTDEKETAVVRITVMEDPDAVKFDRYELDSSAVVTEYNVGDTVDFTGIKVFEVMSDGTRTELTDLTKLTYEYNGAAFNSEAFTAAAGTKSIAVKYDGQSAGAISVRVNDPEKETVAIESITVGGNYKATYEVGDSADFSALTVTVTYAGGEVRTLTAEALTFSALDTHITGQKTITVSFTDPVNEEENSTSFTVNVINKKAAVVQFEKPSSIAAFDSDNKTEGKPAYGESGFSGTFVKGGLIYKVGDDNAFKFTPAFSIMNGTEIKPIAAYYTTVELSIDGTALTAEAAGNTVTYKDGETVIAVVDTFRGSYDFTEDAVGKKVKISVVPSADYYISDDNPVVLEVEVIDAFNVYTAKELAVVDSTGSEAWNTFKLEHGLAAYDPAGIVIHNDISIKAEDVPESFFHVTDTEVSYYKGSKDGEVVKTLPVGTKFLKDATNIYDRPDADDFIIEGNFFQITTQDFPLVASHGIFGNDSDKHFGDDYSNSTLFYFRAANENHGLTAEEIPTINVNNLALRGNAARNDTVDSEGRLVSGGGLIFIKSNHHAITYMDNTICNSYFITYFPNWRGGEMYVSSSKCYDSFQNAAFTYGDVKLEITDSFINGTGGPVILADSVPDGNNVDRYSPVINVKNTVMDSALTGSELWFASVGAESLVGNIQALGAGLAQAGLGNYVNADGKMNIKALLMNEGTSAAAAIGDIKCEGTVLIDGNGIVRWNQTGSLWQTIVNHPAYASGNDPTKWAPFFTVGDGNDPAKVIFFNGTTFCDIQGNALNPANAAHQAIIGAFLASDTITLSQGGLSVVFEFYHGSDAYTPKAG